MNLQGKGQSWRKRPPGRRAKCWSITASCTSRRKAENDFVTEMDFKSENLIREMLLTACPEDAFFGEEGGGATRAPGRWIVDPIDGTANFMRGQRLYTISIAYEHEGELVAGCVYCPGTDEMFLGVRGEGATLNGHPIHVSDIDDLRDAIVHIGFGHRNPEYLAETEPVLFPLLRSISDLRRSGTCAYDLCTVACGPRGGLHRAGPEPVRLRRGLRDPHRGRRAAGRLAPLAKPHSHRRVAGGQRAGSTRPLQEPS